MKVSPTDKRQYLARLRTQMANERTLMAYYRGAFALIGLSLFVFKFFEETIFIYLSSIFLVCGLTLAVYGALRYRKFKRKLMRR